MKIIDTHVHIWDLQKADYPWLKGDDSIVNRTWKIEEIENDRDPATAARIEGAYRPPGAAERYATRRSLCTLSNVNSSRPVTGLRNENSGWE